MPPRGVRTYSFREVKSWVPFHKDETSFCDYPTGKGIPFKFLTIVAMHNGKDRRNTAERLWLSKHVYLHAKLAGGLPAVGKDAVPTSEIRERFIKLERPDGIATALGLTAVEVADAIKFEQKASPSKAAWTKRKLSGAAGKAAARPADLHGVALVEAVLAYAKGKRQRLGKPLPAAGRGLPPSLRRWLEVDSSRIACARGGKLAAGSLGNVFAELGWPAREVNARKLPGKCYLLDVGDQQATFAYTGKLVDDDWPIFTASVEDEAEVALAAPGFDVYIAVATGYLPAPELLGDVPRAYAARMKRQAQANLGGKTVIEVMP